ncbi:ATP-dependent protease LonB [Candidatus Micrarchaeota archaeon CG10_big_fil_rev_8_21_14_0_10_45_29]|nr:MAG: ATP-dependent protease LonB [Candidatus Micrarchaeota archaeon CG10_big_fil_rev_8_21_14_0_10_45_29]
MLAQAMAELMPVTALQDVLVYQNPNDENKPLVRVIPTYPSPELLRQDAQLAKLYMQANAARMQFEHMGKKMQISVPKQNVGAGRMIIQGARSKNMLPTGGQGPSAGILFLLGFMFVLIILYATGTLNDENKWFILAALGAFGLLFLLWRFTNTLGKKMGAMGGDHNEPKLIVDNTGLHTAPFMDGTGNKAGALLGDVKHDPLQSGGLGTPAHLRVESGAIHKANKGVLFIDEISSLKMRWQQEILTAMQEKKYSITGQSEMSSGAIVKTEAVPCDFVLVAAGNLIDMKHMHPAMRSRIRGSGYEVYMEDTMEDTEENENLIVQFVAQEIDKDGKIPHFSRDAVGEIISEARRKAGRKKRFTLNLRELGGLVRAAGDVAVDENASLVEVGYIERARSIALTMEQQMSSKYIEVKKEYEVFSTKGYNVGKVNGLAVMGDGTSGLVMPIVAEVTPAGSKNEGKLIATGKLGSIAREAVENVSAIIKKHLGKNVSSYDVHVQFLQTYEGVEGDSASVSIALAMLSAMEEIPIRQDVAMTGSLSVRGDVLPIGGATAKTEAAIEAGMKEIIVPRKNAQDIYLAPKMRGKIKILPVDNLVDVMQIALKDCTQKKKIISKIKKMIK